MEFPTHIGGNILDLALSRSEDMVYGVQDMGMLGNGDHSLIKVEIVGRPGDRDSMEMVPDWTQANLGGN